VKITIKHLSFFALVIVTSFLSCRKADLNVLPEVNYTSEEFFKLPATVDPEVAKMAQHLKKQDSVLKFLPSFIKKNGIPVWEKIIFEVGSQDVAKRSSARLAGSETTKGYFLFPLSLLLQTILNLT
jgi:hypothetical protein